MSHTKHGLAEEFPAEAGKIAELKQTDGHFAALVSEYNTLNEKVHRAEERLDLLTEEEEEHLRKKRSHVKDHIWAHLKS